MMVVETFTTVVGESQDCPPQDWPHGGQSWGGQSWALSVIRIAHLNYNTIFSLPAWFRVVTIDSGCFDMISTYLIQSASMFNWFIIRFIMDTQIHKKVQLNIFTHWVICLSSIQLWKGKWAPCMIFKLCWKFNLAKKNTCNLIAKHNSAESPDECDQCKKTFGLEGDMQDHKLTHSEDQLPHKCVQCSKSFPFASKLKIHRKIHSGEKLHYCSQCNKSFTGAGTLNKHVLVNSFWRKGTPVWKMQLLNQSS